MTNKGKFIVVEGSDGVGKKTQANLLIKMFRRLGRRVSFYDFPQYERSFFGDMVGQYLNGEFGDVGDVDPRLISLLYAGDRFEASDHIRHDLKRGMIVISNRYTQSNMAFQSAKIKNREKRDEFLEWLEELEFGVFNIPKPDLIIYLYLPYEISQKMVDKKKARSYTNKKRDIHERNEEFLAKVQEEYLRLAKEEGNWTMIDCRDNDGSVLVPKKITEKIFDVISKRYTKEELRQLKLLEK